MTARNPQRSSVLARGDPKAGVVVGAGAFNTYSTVLVEVEVEDEDGNVGYGEALARHAGAMTAVAVESLHAPASRDLRRRVSAGTKRIHPGTRRAWAGVGLELDMDKVEQYGVR